VDVLPPVIARGPAPPCPLFYTTGSKISNQKEMHFQGTVNETTSKLEDLLV